VTWPLFLLRFTSLCFPLYAVHGLPHATQNTEYFSFGYPTAELGDHEVDQVRLLILVPRFGVPGRPGALKSFGMLHMQEDRQFACIQSAYFLHYE
jgi:hypothetical protein